MPHLFFKNILKRRAQRRQILGTYANHKYIMCANFDLLGQKVRSLGQVKSHVHSGTDFKLEDRAMGKVLVRMFSSFQREVL